MKSDFVKVLPEIRRAVIAESFLHCDIVVRDRINEYSSDLVIKTCKRHISLAGKIEVDEPCFNPHDGAIYMDERVDDDEYAEILKHELGHFIDEKMGCPSCKEDFQFAMQADLEQFTSASTGISALGEMLGELMESPVMENRYLSDIFSAMFYGADTARQRNAVVTAYNALGVPVYGHEINYWTGKNGSRNAAQLETFADMFAIFTENNSETVQFVKKWFPNITNCFGIEIERGALHYG